MPVTYNLIASNTLSSSAASVTFSAIPNTYTDLVLKTSVRNDSSGSSQLSLKITLNNDTASNYSFTAIRANGSSASSISNSSQTTLRLDYQGSGGLATSSTFGNSEIYIPNYTAAINKPIGVNGVGENNNATAFMAAVAGLYRNTSSISSIKIEDLDANNFVSGSSFFLYGIKNS